MDAMRRTGTEPEAISGQNGGQRTNLCPPDTPEAAMSVLVELRDRVEKTNALIAQCEDAIVAAGSTPTASVLATVRSLEKLKRRLEAEYVEEATNLDLEVYRYRLLNEDC